MTNESNITDILVKTEKGFIVWSDIETAIEEYKLKLPNPDFLYTKSITFEGLIRYLYRRVIEPIIPKSHNHNYDVLDDIFNNIYVPLCNLFGFQLNILLFCLLCNIDTYNINIIGRGRNTDGSPVTNHELVSHVQKWQTACEAGLYSNVSNHSSIGSMFLLKSVYGYREDQTIRIETDSNAPKIDTKQLQTLAQSAEAPAQIPATQEIELPPDD